MPSTARKRRTLAASAVFPLMLAFTPMKGHAQQPAAQAQISQVAAELDLTAQQEPAFTAIMVNHLAETKALLDKHGVDPSQGRPSRQVTRALRGDMMKNRQKLDTELASLLTPEQMAQFKAMTPQRPRR